MAATDLPLGGWRTSSYSNVGGECMEVAAGGRMIGVRDSKDKDGAALVFSPEAWCWFTAWASGKWG